MFRIFVSIRWIKCTNLYKLTFFYTFYYLILFTLIRSWVICEIIDQKRKLCQFETNYSVLDIIAAENLRFEGT